MTDDMKTRQDALHRAMRSAQHRTAEEVQRRLRATAPTTPATATDPAFVAHVRALLLDADAGERARIRGELIEAGWNDAALRGVGL